jgi:hypothetical protein
MPFVTLRAAAEAGVGAAQALACYSSSSSPPLVNCTNLLRESTDFAVEVTKLCQRAAESRTRMAREQPSLRSWCQLSLRRWLLPKEVAKRRKEGGVLRPAISLRLWRRCFTCCVVVMWRRQDEILD